MSRRRIRVGLKSAGLGFLGCLLASAALGAEATVPDPAAEEPGVGDNPYRAITARNAFRLKDPLPPPPPPTNAPPPPEVPKIDVKLAGVGAIAGVRYAYLMLPDPDRQGQFLYPTLTDDPRRGRVRHNSGVEVREIDLQSQSVRMVNGGIEVTLNLQDNGIQGAPPAAATPGKPGTVPAPRVVANRPAVPARPGTTPGTPAAANNAANAAPLVFSRNPNRASGGNSFTPGGTGLGGGGSTFGVPTTGTTVAGGNLPARPLRTTPANPVAAEPVVPLAEQYEILVRQRAAADSMGIQLPPIPGLPLPTDPQVMVPAQ